MLPVLFCRQLPDGALAQDCLREEVRLHFLPTASARVSWPIRKVRLDTDDTNIVLSTAGGVGGPFEILILSIDSGREASVHGAGGGGVYCS